MNKIFALGFFDGVHLGHQALLQECCKMAQAQCATPCAITFQQHPQSLFTDTPPKLINTQQDRQDLLREFGIGPIFAYPVTEAIMSLSWQAFLEDLLDCDTVGFVCGTDFRFGHRGEGTAEKLAAFCKERNLTCRIVGEQTRDGIRISSTHIRTLLESGQMEEAVRFLGHPHILSGNVISGRQLGRTLGTPTANLLLPEEANCLRHGVYACKAFVDGAEYLAVTNVGTRPTVGGEGVTVEAWLLDFTGNLYGKRLRLAFHKFLRPEVKFLCLEDLKHEIQRNAQQARDFFDKN